MTEIGRSPGVGQRVAAIILAAGKSSRMGEIKQILSLGQTTLLAQTLANTQASAISEIVLVLGAHAERIQQQLPPALLERVKVVFNGSYGQGIATSLQAGLAVLSQESIAALIILGDQPFVQPATLNQLLSEYLQSRSRIVLPVHRGQRGNPVLLDRALFAEAQALEGDTGFRSMFKNYLEEIHYVTVEDSGVLLDIDTPDDYRKTLTKR